MNSFVRHYYRSDYSDYDSACLLGRWLRSSDCGVSHRAEAVLKSYIIIIHLLWVLFTLADNTVCQLTSDGAFHCNWLTSPPTQYHRLRGSASPVLTATHHSYGSLSTRDFLTFFPAYPWRSDPSTDLHAK